jgi:type III secretion protein F
MSVGNTSSISTSFVSELGFNTLSTRESALRETLLRAPAEPTTVDMLTMQQQVQQWSMLVQIVSTIYKEVSDSLKGVVQKSG